MTLAVFVVVFGPLVVSRAFIFVAFVFVVVVVVVVFADDSFLAESDFRVEISSGVITRTPFREMRNGVVVVVAGTVALWDKTRSF